MMSSNAPQKSHSIFGSSGTKRTRSQLAILDFDVSLQRSPLKDARQAVRKVNKGSGLRMQMDDESTGLDDGREEVTMEDDGAGPSDTGKKRPSSPSADEMDTVETKRAKHEQQTMLTSFFTRQPTLKASRTPSLSEKPGSSISSVELTETIPELPSSAKGDRPNNNELQDLTIKSPKKPHNIPYLDLTSVSPSRKTVRSASPGKLNLRIVSDGDIPNATNEDGDSGLRLADAPLADISSKMPSDSATVPIILTNGVEEPFENEDSSLQSTSASLGSDPVSANGSLLQPSRVESAGLTPPSHFDFSSIPDDSLEETDKPVTSNQAGNPPGLLVPLPPLSPLTPLPITPNTHSKPAKDSKSSKLSAPLFSKDIPSKPAETPSDQPGPSRLPRLSIAFPPIQDVTANAHSAANVPGSSKSAHGKEPEKQMQNSKKVAKKNEVSPRKSQTRIHMTRSATLRQIQVQKKMKRRSSSVQPSSARLSGNVNPAADDETRGREETRGRSESRRFTSCPPDSPRATSAQRKNADNRAIQNPKEEEVPPAKRRKRFVLTVPSSLSPTKPTTPGKNRDVLMSPGKSVLPPPITDANARLRSQMTLSNLSNALEKLAQPAPSRPTTRQDDTGDVEMLNTRPSTSLGFNRTISGSSSSSGISQQAPVTPEASTSAVPKKGLKSYFPSSTSERALKTQQKVFPQARSISAGSMAPPNRRTFGAGGNPFSKPSEKARQKSRLSTVVGSPVKGARQEDDSSEVEIIGESRSSDATDLAEGDSYERQPREDVNTSSEISFLFSQGKSHLRDDMSSASRRASMAFSALSQSLPAFNTPIQDPKPPVEEPPSTGPPRITRSLRSNTSFAKTADGLETPVPKEPVASTSTTPAADTSAGASGKKKSNRSKMPGSLDILKRCVIFVDVRTEDGEDAGSLFVDMLRGLGAKILSRVGQSCTHLVYKNGLQSTLTRYRLLEEPRPHVVGIGWVVECVEKREKVDELKFRIELDEENISGSAKRRKSLLPKQLSLYTGLGSFIDDDAEDSLRRETSFEEGNSIGTGDGGRSFVHDNLPPLEKARRRSLMLSQS